MTVPRLPPRAPVSEPTLARVVERVLDLAGRLQGHLAEVAAHHDLTPQQAKLLRSLDEPQPVRTVALWLRCDPSNVTGLIDRIARRGLVERTVHPADGRIRLLALTAAGHEVRRSVERELLAEAVALSALDEDEAAQLVALLDRVGVGGRAGARRACG